MSVGRAQRIAIAAGAAIGLTFVAWWAFNGLGNPYDVQAYHDVNLADPYRQVNLDSGAFLYTPAFALLVAPLKLLPFALVATAWRLWELGALLSLAGPFTALVLFTVPVASELNLANVNLLIATVAVAGLRWPALWAFVLAAKPSCGVGLLWFVVRRDWRSLRQAVVATAALYAVSAVVMPGAWLGYLTLVTHPAPSVHGEPVLWFRLVAGAVVAIVGAARGWRPTIVIATWLALPVWHTVSPSILIGLLAYAWPSFWTGGSPVLGVIATKLRRRHGDSEPPDPSGAPEGPSLESAGRQSTASG